MLQPRNAALEIVRAVTERQRSLDEALEGSADFEQLNARDKAFARMMATTVLRRAGQIDDLILRATEKNELPHPPLLHNLLRIGTVQIVFMSAPDYASVDSAVQMAEASGLMRQKGFVNAVLRRIATEYAAWTAQQNESMNIPVWMREEWTKDYGPDAADAIAQASLAEAPLDITLKDARDGAHWAHELRGVLLPTGSVRRLSGGPVQDLPGFQDGMWWVQDAAASIPATLFGDVTGRSVIDLCAAPGGKTAQLAAAGAQITAIDRSASRIKRLETNLRRLRLDRNVRVINADAAVWQPPEKADCVLVDAPCTATGTIRRNPDILHLKKPDDMVRMAMLQERILENAARMVNAGGMLVYATCSLQKQEGETRIDAFLRSRDGKDFQRLPIDDPRFQPMTTGAGDFRIFPYHLAAHGGMDGFYICCLRKM